MTSRKIGIAARCCTRAAACFATRSIASSFERGSNLDALMRRLYEERGLQQITWRQSDLPAMADSLVGDPLPGFFDGLVATKAPLPLDGRFELLPRE